MGVQYKIIIMVAVIAAIGSAVVALAVYLIDKTAERNDKA
jgi:hypothetical protein